MSAHSEPPLLLLSDWLELPESEPAVSERGPAVRLLSAGALSSRRRRRVVTAVGPVARSRRDGVRVPSSSRPVSASSTSSTPPQQTAESAALNTGKKLPSGREQRDHVDDVALQRAGRAEEPVAQVAQRTAEHQAQRDGPAGGAQPPRHPDQHDRRRRSRSG